MPADARVLDTPRARVVLGDCASALERLKQNPRGVHWRLAWCSVITLLRAVGHVLEYEMRSPATSPEMREAWREWWARVGKARSEHAIFWEFIQEDRNALLKEYRFNAEQGFTESGGGIGTMPIGAAPIGGGIMEPTYLMKEGPFTGRDQRDVVQDAITWWEHQLDEISTRAAAALIEKLL